jgi:hypothetical protein
VHGDSGGRVRFRCVICGCISRGAVPQTPVFAVLLVATAVSFAAAGLTVAGLLGLLAAVIPPFSLCFVLIGGAMVVDVMFGLWLCVLCQICQIHCYMEE